jgi:ribosomal protein L16 Arg81 hydroxylase
MLGARYLFRLWGAVAVFALAAAAAHAARSEPSVEELKGRLASTSIGNRPHLCVQIAQKQMVEADKQYAAAEVEKGQAALTDVVNYSELARDYAIQSHKYQKQTEIAARALTRKLNDLMHSLGQEDQPPVRDAINRLERVRDDLLKAMFPKGAK